MNDKQTIINKTVQQPHDAIEKSDLLLKLSTTIYKCSNNNSKTNDMKIIEI